VDVVLRVSRNMPVSENTTAVVARNLVTGIARINLETPGKPGPELRAAPAGERFPVIPEGTSDLDQIATSLNRLAQKSNTGLDNLNRVMDPANQKALADTLQAVRDLTQGLRDRLPLLDSSARGISSAAVEFQRTSQELGTATRSVNSMIQPIGQETTAALRDARAALQIFTETGRALEQRVNASLSGLDAQIGTLTSKSTGALDVGVLELRATAEELRTSVELISRALDRLQDPKAALFGPSNEQYGPGEEPRR
jgi:ABC-type transporter Mla subunit MlaD